MKTSKTGAATVQEVDGGFELDWWVLILTAGACGRAARSEPDRAQHWTAAADVYSARANVLLQWDASTWRNEARPRLQSGPFARSDDEDTPR